MIKKLIALSLAITACSANASFDVWLIPDGQNGVVQRYDPIHRVSLGSFSAMSNVRAVAGHTNMSTVYASDGNLTVAYNASTGERGGNFGNLPGTGLLLDNAKSVLFYAGSGMGRLDIATRTGIFQSPSFTPVTVLQTAGNVFAFMGLDTSNNLVVQHFDRNFGAIGTLSILLLASGINANAGVGQAAFGVTSTGLPSAYVGFRSPSNNISIVRFNINGSGLVTSSGNVTSSGSFSTVVGSPVNILRGHNGMFAIGRDATTTTSTRIIELADNASMTQLNSYVTTTVTVPSVAWSGASIVAPEPATLAVLAGSLFAMNRKRKRN